MPVVGVEFGEGAFFVACGEWRQGVCACEEAAEGDDGEEVSRVRGVCIPGGRSHGVEYGMGGFFLPSEKCVKCKGQGGGEFQFASVGWGW